MNFLYCQCDDTSVWFPSQAVYLALGPCKAGYYCSRNSSKELPCEEGRYSNITGLFDKSGCKMCPFDAYCPLGSPLPIPCPLSKFFPARRTIIKISHGRRNRDECRLCPVDPCDAVGKCGYFAVHFDRRPH